MSMPATAPKLRLLTPLDRENELRGRLGLLAVGEKLPLLSRVSGWIGPLAMMFMGLALRLWDLGHPDRIIFDETYYVKDAFTLDTFGFSTKWEPIDKDNANQYFNQGDFREMTDVASYVVHGELGKWFIVIGMRLFGADNPFGWRFSAAIAGTLMVFLVGRIAMRIFRSGALATLAAGLVAIDGVGLTLSRIGLLDVFLAVLILAGFWAVLRDRDSSRARLARRFAQDGWWEVPPGPRVGFRGWLLVAGVLIGASAGVKWSGFYAAAVFGLAVWVWDMRARQLVGAPRFVLGGVARGGLPAFFTLVPVIIVSYVATWFSWFKHPDAFMRQWAATRRAAGEELPREWLPDTWNSFLEYHLKMYDFHSNLDSEHSYMAHPIGWLLQLRPTSFYWQNYDDQDQFDLCGADRCVGAITSIGNPFIWWGAFLALGLVIWMAVRFRDGRAGMILVGYGATYLPWFIYGHRTVFQFYTVAILPFVALALTYGIGMLTQRLAVAAREDPEGLASSRVFSFTRRRDSRRTAILISGILFVLILLATLFWWPIWTGMIVPYEFWRFHMWLPTWP